MRYIKYLFSYLSLAIAYVGMLQGGWKVWLLVVYGFVLVPLIELFFKGSMFNFSEEEEKQFVNDKLFDWIIYLSVPLHYGLLVLFCFSISPEMPWWEMLGYVFTLGLSCGVYGINVAHELGHRLKKSEQWMAKSLLLTSQYMHFFIEHNRGHHQRVSTDEDPASSRFNEPVYLFWVRSIVFSYVSAWELEHFRLEKMGLKKWSLQNEMIVFTLIQIAFIALIFILFGGFVTVCYLGSALIGVLLLETVNYIEHYGLRRKQGEHGYHKVLPIHSWNSNHPLGRIILFELSRHSDHHYRANRKYQILRYHGESPQMPTGYPGMMVLSLFPPVWFMVMNPRVKKLQATHSHLD